MRRPGGDDQIERWGELNRSILGTGRFDFAARIMLGYAPPRTWFGWTTMRTPAEACQIVCVQVWAGQVF